MWETLLEGSLILGVLTAVIGILKDKMDRKLQYITSERAKWREEIREIAQKLQSAGEYEIDKILCELKVKINTYGIANQDNVFQDAHIWKIIRTLENAQNLDIAKREVEIKKAKETLIKYLSCLLKNDWERSKMEVTGHSTITLCAIISILFFISIVVCCILAIKIDIKSFDIGNINDYAFITMIIVTGSVVFLNFSMIYLQIKIINMQDYFMQVIIDKKNFICMYMKNFGWLILYTIFWIVYIFFLYNISESENEEIFFK